MPGSRSVSLLQDGLQRVCEAGVAACKADPASQATMEQARASMQAALEQLNLESDSENPGWALLAGGDHGIDSLLVAPLANQQKSMLYCFVQSNSLRREASVSLADILEELRANLDKNGMQLPTLDKYVPGDGLLSHDAESIIHMDKILM